MAPRAGGRSQRQTQVSQAGPSRTQNQRGTQAKRGRNAIVEDPEEEEEEDDGDAAEGMDVDAATESNDQEIDRRANDLVRIALFMEHKRLPLRREDITKKVLAPHTKLFNKVFAAAQRKLNNTFGMELVEQPSRAGLEQEAGPSGAGEDDLTQARKATGIKKRSAATGSKSYILRSTLNAKLIDFAAQTDAEILEEEAGDFPSDEESDLGIDVGDDEERPPRSFGSIISWSHTEQVGPLGILYVLLALILVHGRVLPDMEMRFFLKQLHLPPNCSPVHFSTSSTTRSLSTDGYLFLLQRQGYLERRAIGDTARPGAGNKRVRATQASRDDGEGGNQMFEWRWGPRAMCEVGEQKIAEFVGEFMVDGVGEDDENEAARGRSKQKKEEGVQKMVVGIEKAAGGRLNSI